MLEREVKGCAVVDQDTGVPVIWMKQEDHCRNVAKRMVGFFSVGRIVPARVILEVEDD